MHHCGKAIFFTALFYTCISTIEAVNSPLACNSLPSVGNKYRHCERTSGDHVTCTCQDCDLKVTLTCDPQLAAWTPIDGVDLCEARDPWFGCQRCVPPRAVQDLQCENDGAPGYLSEVRRCRCKHTCLDLSITCHMDDLWHYDCTVPVLQFIPSRHLSLHFNSSLHMYTFHCAPGYHIRGEHRLLCQDARFGGPLPECLPHHADEARILEEPASFTHLARLRRKFWRHKSRSSQI